MGQPVTLIPWRCAACTAAKHRCKGCGKPEEINAIGYTTIAPFLGYCVECINKAMQEVRD
jgi:hypothetical protein